MRLTKVSIRGVSLFQKTVGLLEKEKRYGDNRIRF